MSTSSKVLSDRVDQLCESVKTLTTENAALHLRIATLEGKNLSLSNQVTDLKTEVEKLTYHAMQTNLWDCGRKE